MQSFDIIELRGLAAGGPTLGRVLQEGFEAGWILFGTIREPGGNLDRMNRFRGTFDERVELMTKAELVTQVALKTELTKQQTLEVVDLFLQCIIEALQEGDKVELRGFGSFRRRDRRSDGDPPELLARRRDAHRRQQRPTALDHEVGQGREGRPRRCVRKKGRGRRVLGDVVRPLHREHSPPLEASEGVFGQ